VFLFSFVSLPCVFVCRAHGGWLCCSVWLVWLLFALLRCSPPTAYCTTPGNGHDNTKCSKQYSTTGGNATHAFCAQHQQHQQHHSLHVVATEKQGTLIDSKQEDKEATKWTTAHDTRGVGKKQMEDRKKSRRVGKGRRKGKRRESKGNKYTAQAAPKRDRGGAVKHTRHTTRRNTSRSWSHYKAGHAGG